MLQESLKGFLHKQIFNLKSLDCYRLMKVLDGAHEARVSLNGKEVLNLSSNNYLGLASSSLLKQAGAKALADFGAGAGASRLISGNLTLHEELEKKISAFKKTQAALLFNCGYMANCGLLSALCQRGDVIFSDRSNHASIIDGILLSRAKLFRYAHKDMDSLTRLLSRQPWREGRESKVGREDRHDRQGGQGKYGKAIIVTDSVFSMDGDLAPLREIAALAREYGASVMVDEAHATGVLGAHGRGALELLNLEGEIDIQMGTLGKALGGFGAYVAGDSLLIDYLINRARPFIFTTALPPAVIASAIKALDIVENRTDLRDTLLQQANWFRRNLQEAGFNTMESETQIIPIMVGDNEKTVQFSQKLLEAGIYTPAIRPPTVPQGTARLRISLMATHTMADLEEALMKIVQIGQNLRII